MVEYACRWSNILIMCIYLLPQIVLRINCLSTEFSSQKGVKGLPLHVVIDIYEDLENEAAEPVHRAYCRVKIFRDKVRGCLLDKNGNLHSILQYLGQIPTSYSHRIRI